MGLAADIQEVLIRAFLPGSTRGRQARIKKHFHSGVLRYAEGRYRDSEQELRKALEVSQEAGATRQLAAGTLKKLGDFYQETGQYARAEEFYRQSLQSRREIYPEGHQEILIALNDLALLQYVQGRYEESDGLYQQLLNLLEDHLGQDHREVAVCLENYAALLRKLHRNEESERLRQKAKSIRQKIEEVRP